MTFNIVLRKTPRKDGKCPVKLYLANKEGDKIKEQYLSLNIWINPRCWSKKNKRVTEAELSHKDYNSHIIEAEGKIEKILREQRPETIAQAIELYEAVRHAKTNTGQLLPYIKDVIERVKEGRVVIQSGAGKGRVIQVATSRSYGNLHYRLSLFSNNLKKPLTFNDIAEPFYNDYIYFLRHKFYVENPALLNKKKDNSNRPGLAENTIGSEIKVLKVIMRMAASEGLHSNFAFKNFSVIRQEVDTISLTAAEMEKFMNVKLPDHLIEEQDRAIVAYNFLLRFSDSIKITKGDIQVNKDGRFLKLRTTKTGADVLVPIKERTWQILEKNNFQIPFIHNQESNWKLKEIGRIAEINTPTTRHEYRAGQVMKSTVPKYELITTHTFRRSAATNLYMAGADLSVIMVLGGWKTEAQVLAYIKAKEQMAALQAVKLEFFK